jgi:hypothetical protein
MVLRAAFSARIHPGIPIDAVKLQVVAGLSGEFTKKEAYRAAIPLSEGVNEIDLPDMERSALGEGIPAHCLEIVLAREKVELTRQRIRHEAPVQEAGRALDEAVAGPDLARPRVDRLEQMLVNGAHAKDRDVQIGERLLLSDLRVQPFDPVKRVAGEIQMVPEGIRPWNGEGIGVIEILHPGRFGSGS